MLYSELQCSEAIHKAVERMGFAEMTEIQEKTIPVMLAGRDVIAKAPTGTGKTCAFGIPVAEHIDPEKKYPQAVIMAPTRELAQQIAEELTELTYFMPEVQVACVYGGANMEKQARRLAEGCQIVVATPGRLMDHYKHHSINLAHVTQVVLDEADEMLNMGFYKDVRHIIELMKARKSLSMFSATISREVMDIGWLYQNNAEEITVQPREESQPKITQYMLETSGRNKLSDLAQIIIGEGYKRVMVFCDTKFNTATLANQLARLGFSVDCLHGDLSQKERNQIMQNFRDGKLAILVATDVAARGIDLENLTHVINFGIPASYETYVHRIGRTGRAGRTGTAITILEPREHRHIRALERATRSKIEIRTVPSATDVQAKRLEVTRGAIAEILAQGGLERYNVIVEALCEEHDPIEVAAAAVRLALESEGTNDDDMEIPAFGDRRDRRERSERPERPERPRRERGEPEEGMTRLFIGAGRMSGVRPGDIVGAIANEANVSSRQIGAIDISDRFTLAEVDSAVAQQVIDALQGVRFKGRPITVKLDQGAPREERGDRGRSDRFEREGRNDRYDRPERKRFDRDDRSERYSRFDDDNRRRGPRR